MSTTVTTTVVDWKTLASLVADASILKDAVAQGAFADAPQLRAALYASAAHDACDSIRFLVEEKNVAFDVPVGVEVSVPHSVESKLPIHGAAAFGAVNAIALLVSMAKSCSRVDLVGMLLYADDSGLTPLHTAATHCQPGAVGALAEAVVEAAGDNTSAKLLKKKLATMYDKDGMQPLHHAAALAHAETARAIVTHFGAEDSTDLVRSPTDTERLTPLHIAAQGGNMELVRALLELGADVHARTDNDSNAMTPLHVACLSGRRAAVAALIAAGANVDAADTSGQCALHTVCVDGQLELIRLLLKAGANVSATTKSGLQPVHVAAARGHAEAMLLLLAAGADVTVADSSKRNVLQLGVSGGHVRVAHEVLKHASAKLSKEAFHAMLTAEDEDAWQSIHFAAARASGRIVKCLLEHGADGSAKTTDGGVTPLHMAVQAGSRAAVEALIASGVDVNAAADGALTPLIVASQHQRSGMIPLLLAAGADPGKEDAYGQTPLRHAVAVGEASTILALTKAIAPDATAAAAARKGAAKDDTLLHLAAQEGKVGPVVTLLATGMCDVNASVAEGQTALHSAAMNGHVDIVRLLAGWGCNLDATTSDGITPLILACESSSDECVQVLLELGADVSVRDHQGCMPLHRAAHAGLKNAVRLILDAGASVDTWDERGWTALHYAAAGGDAASLEAVIEGHAEVNSVAEDQSTPLHLAAACGHVEAVSALVAHGSAVDARDGDGRTAVEIARAAGHDDVVEALEGAQAKAPKGPLDTISDTWSDVPSAEDAA